MNIRHKIIKYLLNENEKCLINQALNQEECIRKKELVSGLYTNSDYIKDSLEIKKLLSICENKLWK